MLSRELQVTQGVALLLSDGEAAAELRNGVGGGMHGNRAAVLSRRGQGSWSL